MENQKITTSNEKFSIATLTWNCAGKIPYKIDFGELLHCEESSDSPDIILLGFQEIVELSIFSLFTGLGKEKMCDFLAKVIEDLDAKFGEDYNVFAAVNMMGLLLVSISKNKILSQISNVNKTDVPLGFGGTIGNKGAVLISFSLNETSIVCA